MAKVILTKGLPASGKSTWAKEQVKTQKRTKRVNKDDLRMMIDGAAWSKENERMILAVRDNIILESLRSGHSIIVDDTNLNPKMERGIRQLVNGEFDVEVNDSFLSVPLEECIRRDALRESPVTEKVIRDMHYQWENHWKDKDCSLILMDEDKAPAFDPMLPNCVIVDVDGTLALNTGGRSPYDFSRVLEDTVNTPVAYLINLLYDSRDEIIVFSGRDDSCYDATDAWLTNNLIPFDRLYMRATGDKRKDSIVKKELYDRYIRGKYNVSFVVDDRTQVVHMWREVLGLPCFQVNWGNF